jgi:multicomponent Na+:H+ antiporter subunit B
MAVALTVAVAGLPREHAALPAVARYALAISLPVWHLTEPVNEIVYGTRGFDTFGETFLLLAAVVSIIVLTRSRERRTGYVGEERAGKREQQEVDPPGSEGADVGSEREAREAEREEEPERPDDGPLTPDDEPLGTPAPERAEAMTVVVRGAVRVVLPLLLVAGFYLVAWGYAPGGGFPAGAVLLGVVLLAYAAFGDQMVRRVVRPSLVEAVELAGAAAIIAVELLGLLLKGSFTANWLPLGPAQTIRSGGVVQAFSVAEFVEVGTGLTIAVFALLGMRHDWSPDEAEPDASDEDGQGSESDVDSTGDGR